MQHDELLARLADTLRRQVGPAVEEDYPKTQAFMASVILERVSRELALQPAHRAAEHRDMLELAHRLGPVLIGGPADVVSAHEKVVGVASLGPLIEALYRWGVDEPPVGEALDLIRPVLRRDIDRRMEIAR